MGDDIKTRWLLTGLGLLFLAAALAAPVNHDESQYVAAIALMREGLPYRDWAYLQTPLQPLLLSPLSLLPAGWLLVGARLANAVFALVTCWAVLRLLRGRVPFWAAATAIGAMATTNAFLFAAEVARNDALPAALLSLGLLALDRRRTLVAGLCFGLAISAKISLALPVAGIGLWLLWQERKAVRAAVLGGAAGLLPCFILYALAPQQFMFGVFTYNLEAPQQFWALVGEAKRLTALGKLGDLAEETVKGATVVALILWLSTLRQGGPERRMLDYAIAGSLLGAWLPDPFFRQYLVPLLAPLFARVALELPMLTPRWRRTAIGAGLATTLVGVSGTVASGYKAIEGPWPLAESVERGRMVVRIAAGHPVATLSPEDVVGADIRLHPGFATGPFLFRTSGDLARRAHAITGAPTWEMADARTLDLPPFVMTGGETKPRPPLFPSGVEAPLERLIASRYYKAIELPGEGRWLWVAPSEKEWSSDSMHCPPADRHPACLALRSRRD